MISGANEKELDIANQIADLLLEKEELQQENKKLKEDKKKVIEYFKYQLDNLDFYEDTKAKMLCAMGITLLQEGDKE